MTHLKKHSSLLFLLTVLLTIIFINLSCEDNPVTPNEPPPGRRDYTWEVDTLDILFNNLDKLWGSSANDVWAIGSGGSVIDFVWHYGGSTWSSYGKSVWVVPYGINGFNRSDLWIGGQDGIISHFDGNKWEKVYQIENPGYYDFYGITDFAGNSSNDMYAIGFADSANVRLSLVYHFDGNSWMKINSSGINISLNRIRKEEAKDRYYINGFIFDNLGEDSNAAVLFENDKFNLIDKERYSTASITVQKIGEYVYMTKEQEIYRLNGTDRTLIYKVNDSNFGLQSYGRNEKDIFLRMFDGVAHYNGTNHEYLFRFEGNKSIRDIAVFESDIFVLINDDDNNVNLIYHGKLQEEQLKEK
ncbi:MAG TPA: hypothetical protein VK982_13645 [Bacteroidales bacterium]|nr:hypothetical protein [Bacteroidales bacterium]